MTVASEGVAALNDAADARIQKICSAVVGGTVNEAQARVDIAGILFGTGILSKVVASSTLTSQADRDEVENRLTSLLTRKIISNDNDKGFDIKRGVSTSACGWYRQFATTALASEVRNVRAELRRAGDPFDHRLMGETGSGWSESNVQVPWTPLTQANRTSAEVAYEQHVADLEEAYRQRVRPLRGSKRDVIAVETLCQAFNLRPPARPTEPDDREFIIETLKDDEQAAYRSLDLYFQLLTGDRTADSIDESMKRIMQVWKGQSVDEVDKLLERPAYVAHAFAMEGARMRPRPSNGTLQRFTRCVTAVDESTAWHDLATGLCDSYIATEFEAVSAYNAHRYSEQQIQELVALNEQHAANWPVVVAEAASYGHRPLGPSKAHVRRRLDGLAVGSGAIEVMAL